MTSHVEPATLRRYTQGALEEEEIGLVEAHLDLCEACSSLLTAEVTTELSAQARVLSVLPRPPRVARRWWAGGSVMALAAAVFLVVLQPSPPPLDTTWSVEVAAGIQATRGASGGAPATIPLLAPSDDLVVLLRPASPTAGEGLQVRVFAGERPVDADLTVDPGGSIKVSVPLTQLGGESSVTIGVGPAGTAIPEVPKSATWQFYRAEFVRVAAG